MNNRFKSFKNKVIGAIFVIAIVTGLSFGGRQVASAANIVAIDGSSTVYPITEAVAPSAETVENGSYTPLSRPLFIYVSAKSINRLEVKKFVDFYLKEGPALAREVGYISLPGDIMNLVKQKFQKRITGSVYGGKPGVGKSLKIQDEIKVNLKQMERNKILLDKELLKCYDHVHSIMHMYVTKLR